MWVQSQTARLCKHKHRNNQDANTRTKPQSKAADANSSQESELSMEVEAAGCLTAEQKDRLFGTLIQSTECSKSKPGKSNCFEIER